MLTPETVVSPKEKTYFTIALVLALLGWVGLTFSTCGVVWIFLGILALLVFFTNGLLIASLRAEAVEVHPQQIGALDAAFREVCATLRLTQIPDLYVLQSGGTLNAFATRHAGRHFVVIYSDMLEAFGPDSPEMKFLLGHEVGHIQRRHLSMRLLLAPALFLPLIGPAYSRACESTCDRYGALACGDVIASMRAMMTLAGGKEAGRAMDPHHFADQHHKRRGFFVSWYELISGYPTLSRRVRDLRALGGDAAATEPEPGPPRHPLGYLFALFTFGGGFGGRGSLLTTFIFLYMLLVLPLMMGAALADAQKSFPSPALEDYQLDSSDEESSDEEFSDDAEPEETPPASDVTPGLEVTPAPTSTSAPEGPRNPAPTP